MEADGLGCIADEIDGDALEDVGGEVECGECGGAGDGDSGCAGGDAFEDGREVA